MDINLSEEVARLKKELVDIISENLQNNQIDSASAQKLASDFLAILPIQSWNDLLVKLKTFTQAHIEAKELYVEELSKDERLKSEQAINLMRDHIKKGDIEGAISVAKTMPKPGSA